MFGFNKSQIVAQVEELIAPIAVEYSVEIVQVEFNQGGRTGHLRIYIDKPGGVTLDDCARFSKEVGVVVDGEDVIEGEYTLEVSSPGFKRPLNKAKDFERFLGHKVLINLHSSLTNAPDDNQRKYRGILAGYGDGVVKMTDVDGREVAIPENLISKANLDD